MKNNEKQQSWNVFSSPYLIFHAFQMLAIFFIKVYVHICTVVNTVCKDLHAYLYTVFNTFYKCWHAYLFNFQHLYKYVHAYLYSFEYFCKYLHAYFYIFNTFTHSYMLIWTVFNNFPNIYMLICHPKVALPIAPGGHLSHQPGKCMISYAHLQMQINGSGWFPLVSNVSVWFQWCCRWFTQLFQHVSLAFKTSYWDLPRSTSRAITR